MEYAYPLVAKDGVVSIDQHYLVDTGVPATTLKTESGSGEMKWVMGKVPDYGNGGRLDCRIVGDYLTCHIGAEISDSRAARDQGWLSSRATDMMEGGMVVLMFIGVVAGISWYVGGKAPKSPLGQIVGRVKAWTGRESLSEKAARLAPQARLELADQTRRVADLRVAFEKSRDTKAALEAAIQQLSVKFEKFAAEGRRSEAQLVFERRNDAFVKLERLIPVMDEQGQLIARYMDTIRSNRKQLDEVTGAVEHQAAMNELEHLITDLHSESSALMGGQANTAIGELKGLSSEIDGQIRQQRELRKVREELGDSEPLLIEDISDHSDFEAAFSMATTKALPEPQARIEIEELNSVER